MVEIAVRLITAVVFLVSTLSLSIGNVSAQDELELALIQVRDETVITGDLSTQIVATFPAVIPQVVVDAGFKSMSAYHHAPLPFQRDDLELRGLSAEHGIFSLRDGAAGPRVGDKVRFVVGYGDSTTVLHDALLGVRRGRVECVWQIAGRGRLQ